MNDTEEIEEVDAIPVLASQPGRALIRSVAPAAQAVAVAAGGFIAGVAVVELARGRHGRGARSLASGRRGARKGGGRGRRGELVRIVGTRSLLVDVHLLGGAER